MSDFFLTNPDNQDDEDRNTVYVKPKGSASIRYKERVAVELQALGVGKFTSEVAVIDLRSMYIPFYHDRSPPSLAAESMLERVTQIYYRDKKWSYD